MSATKSRIEPLGSMKCKTCMWYVEKDSGVIGRCRWHAPPTMNGYPVVYPADWCGDHKLDELKAPVGKNENTELMKEFMPKEHKGDSSIEGTQY